jgi:hypothetical protein
MSRMRSRGAEERRSRGLPSAERPAGEQGSSGEIFFSSALLFMMKMGKMARKLSISSICQV